jgi:flagellar biosynthesis protein FlhB
MSDKTEEPTPRRLRRAREEGDSPVSLALVQSAGFVVAAVALPGAALATTASFSRLVRAALEEPAAASPVVLALEVLGLSLPLIAAAALASAVVGFVQTGGVFAFHKLAPELARTNPITGLSNLFKLPRLFAVARALATALIIGWLAMRIVTDQAPALAETAGSTAAGAALALDVTRRLLWLAALVGLALSAVDLVVVRRTWLKNLRMSKHELRHEFKESEGDPEIKGARRRAHQEMLEGSMIAAVREATVVIVNPTHLASALFYDSERDQAPRLIAQGEGELARRMIDAARAYGVPVVQDVPVAHALRELELGDEIPEALYEAIAEILREIWEQAERSADGKPVP